MDLDFFIPAATLELGEHNANVYQEVCQGEPLSDALTATHLAQTTYTNKLSDFYNSTNNTFGHTAAA